MVQVEQIFRDIENMCFLRTGAGMKSVMKKELTVVEAILQVREKRGNGRERGRYACRFVFSRIVFVCFVCFVAVFRFFVFVFFVFFFVFQFDLSHLVWFCSVWFRETIEPPSRMQRRLAAQ